MNKKILTIALILVIIIAIVIISFSIVKGKKEGVNSSEENNVSENNDINDTDYNNGEYPKDLESLFEIPEPDWITFYHEENKKTFLKGSNEFNEIITINNKRDSEEIAPLKLVVFLEEMLNNEDMLEYGYDEYESIYFSLAENEDDWVCVDYDSKVFNQHVYGGLSSPDELIDYLYSLI